MEILNYMLTNSKVMSKVINEKIVNDFLDVFDGVGIATSILISLTFLVLKFLFFPLLAFGIYKLSKNKGLKMSFLSFIPLINLIYIGILVKEVNILGWRIKHLYMILPMLYILGFIPLGALPGIGIIESLFEKTYLIFFLISMHRLYEIYTPKKADAYIIIGTILSFMIPIFTYKIRNNAPVNSKLVLDYDLDGQPDENVNIYEYEKEINKEETNPIYLEQLVHVDRVLLVSDKKPKKRVRVIERVMKQMNIFKKTKKSS